MPPPLFVQVGGPAKSQLVHEVDALGGEIGKMADRWWVVPPVSLAGMSTWCCGAAAAALGKRPKLQRALELRWQCGAPERMAGVAADGLASPSPCPPPHFAPCPHLLHARSYLQKRVLNASKGPAVWALRAQTDKLEYAASMRRVLEETPNLYIREGGCG